MWNPLGVVTDQRLERPARTDFWNLPDPKRGMKNHCRSCRPDRTNDHRHCQILISGLSK